MLEKRMKQFDRMRRAFDVLSWVMVFGLTLLLMVQRNQKHEALAALRAERAHSATCQWWCPGELRETTAEYERLIAALEAREEATRREWLEADPADVCSLALVRNAVREFPRSGPRPLDQETIDARVYELALTACIANRYMHEAHPNHIGYESWVQQCAAAGYRNAVPGIPSRMLTPNDPDEEIR